MSRNAEPDRPLAPRSRQREILLALAIVAAALLVYIPAMRGGFFWDDDRFLYANKMIHAPDGLRRFWFSTEPADYFPLTSSVLWLEWRVWGMKPAGYHIINVLLHAAGAVLVWRVLRRLRVPGAWLAGLLFAVHPVGAASAAWITELKNTLPMVFYLLSLLAFMSFEEGGGKRWYGVAIGLFTLALLAKTSIVVLPLVLLLCAWWRRGRISRKDLLRSLPFFALALALGLATVWFQHHRAIAAGEIVRPEDVASRVATSGWIVWFYLYKTVLPAGLCVIYPRWSVAGSSVLAFLPLALLIAGLAWLWTRRRSWGRAPLFALAYFIIALLPVLGFVDMSLMEYSFVADHLQYVAMVAVIAFAAGILGKLAAAEGARAQIAKVAAAACAVILGAMTFHRAGLYGHDLDLWRDNVQKNPSAYLAWNNLGWACSREGRFDEAAESFGRAVELKPDYAMALNGRGAICSIQRRFDDALRDFSEAIRLKRDYAGPYGNRAVTYWELKEYDKAWADVKRFRELGGKPNPDFIADLAAASGRKE